MFTLKQNKNRCKMRCERHLPIALGAVVRKVNVLLQALVQVELERSFANCLGRCAFLLSFWLLLVNLVKFRKVGVDVILYEVGLVLAILFLKRFDVNLVVALSAKTFEC